MTKLTIVMYISISKDFYLEAGNGSELWIMIVVNTVTMTQMADLNNDYATKLLNAAKGAIRLLGITRTPDSSYVPVYAGDVDGDVLTAMQKAQALANEYTAMFQPLRVVVEGRAFQGDFSELQDLHQFNYNRVMGVLSDTETGMGNLTAAVGLVLGVAASVSVQRNLGRVRRGPLQISEAYLSDGSNLDNMFNPANIGKVNTVYNKGWLSFRKYEGRTGWYFTDDLMACPLSDDFYSLANGRVIDKACIITNNVYVEDVLDDIEVDSQTGGIAPAIVKTYQTRIENAVRELMAGEISSFKAIIDPLQNILVSSEFKISLRIVPKGYNRVIAVDLALANPFNN